MVNYFCRGRKFGLNWPEAPTTIATLYFTQERITALLSNQTTPVPPLQLLTVEDYRVDDTSVYFVCLVVWISSQKHIIFTVRGTPAVNKFPERRLDLWPTKRNQSVEQFFSFYLYAFMCSSKENLPWLRCYSHCKHFKPWKGAWSKEKQCKTRNRKQRDCFGEKQRCFVVVYVTYFSHLCRTLEQFLGWNLS